MDWQHPTDEMLAALAIARTQKPRNVSDIMAAEMIVMSTDLFMYTQAQLWANEAPGWVDESARAMFKMHAKVALKVLNKGYDEHHNTWWYMGDMDKQARAALILQLMDMGDILKRVRHSMYVIAPSWFIFIDLVCGNDWEKRYARFQERIKSLDVKSNRGKR